MIEKKNKRKREKIPSNPSEEKKKGDSMAGLSSEVGDDLRDLCNSPTN